MLLLLVLLFAAVCGWTLFSGLRKMRQARDAPDHPQAPMLARFGRIQAILGGAALLLNILVNLPALRALL